jgi:general stress protein 26
MDNQNPGGQPAQDIPADARKLATGSRFVYVTTLDEAGNPETRVMFSLRTGRDARKPVFTSLGSEFATYLGTNTSSRKTAQIRRDGRACLYYSQNTVFKGLTLKGRLDEVDDPAVKAALWKPAWEMYYPGGLEGGDFSVFRFTPMEGRYYHGLAVKEFHAR